MPDKIKLQILKASYYSHMKADEELARFVDNDHPNRVELLESIKKIVEKIEVIES